MQRSAIRGTFLHNPISSHPGYGADPGRRLIMAFFGVQYKCLCGRNP